MNTEEEQSSKLCVLHGFQWLVLGKGWERCLTKHRDENGWMKERSKRAHGVHSITSLKSSILLSRCKQRSRKRLVYASTFPSCTKSNLYSLLYLTSPEGVASKRLRFHPQLKQRHGDA